MWLPPSLHLHWSSIGLVNVSPAFEASAVGFQAAALQPCTLFAAEAEDAGTR
jgi:hypothetical protein